MNQNHDQSTSSPLLYGTPFTLYHHLSPPQNSPALAERTRCQTLRTHDSVCWSFPQSFRQADAKIVPLIQQMVLHMYYAHGAQQAHGKKRTVRRQLIHPLQSLGVQLQKNNRYFSQNKRKLVKAQAGRSKNLPTHADVTGYSRNGVEIGEEMGSVL